MKKTQEIRQDQLLQVQDRQLAQKRELQKQLRDMDIPLKIGEVLVNRRLLINNQVYRMLTILEEDLTLTANVPPIELLPVSNLTSFFAPTSEIASRYRRLRFQIFPRQLNKQTPRKVMFTSIMQGEGKTATSLNVAGAIATGIADKAIWIECNFANPVKEIFLEQNPKGLANVLSEEIDLTNAIRQTQFERLKILPAGHTHLNPSEIISSNAMARLVEQLYVGYPDHLLIFDAPAILSPIDISSLASLMDGIVLIVQAHHTSSKLFRKALEQIDQEKILGIVINYANRREVSDSYRFNMTVQTA